MRILCKAGQDDERREKECARCCCLCGVCACVIAYNLRLNADLAWIFCFSSMATCQKWFSNRERRQFRVKSVSFVLFFYAHDLFLLKAFHSRARRRRCEGHWDQSENRLFRKLDSQTFFFCFSSSFFLFLRSTCPAVKEQHLPGVARVFVSPRGSKEREKERKKLIGLRR